MTINTLEDRVTILEKELESLKQQLTANQAQDVAPGWKQIVGVFKDDPYFDEAERLGREWRDAQQMEYDTDADISA